MYAGRESGQRWVRLGNSHSRISIGKSNEQREIEKVLLATF